MDMPREEKTIPDVFFETAAKFSQKAAVLYKESGVYKQISFGKLSEKARFFSAGLGKLGMKKGGKAAILSGNRPEWAIADLAIMAAGGIVVPLHTALSSNIIFYILDNSEAKIAVCEEKFLDKILAVKNQFSFLEKIIVIGNSDRGSSNSFFNAGPRGVRKNGNIKILKWEDVMSLGEKEGDKKPPRLSAGDVCAIIYTSGSTGLPKGAELTHFNVLSNFYSAVKAIPVKSGDVFLSFLPLSHAFERLAGHYVPLFSGASIAYAESVKTIKENILEVRPTIIIVVPRFFEKIYEAVYKAAGESVFKKTIFFRALKQKSRLGREIADWLVFKKIRERFGGRLRLAVSGGAALDRQIGKFFLKIGILILEGYGLTETSPVISVNRENDFKFGSAGKPIDGVEVKISSDKEILARGANVFGGYFKNPKESRAAIDENGWFRTGDSGFIDGDGFLFVIGRKKEMFVSSGGKNVWPSAVEEKLNGDFLISQSMIVGDKRKFISALIVPERGELEKLAARRKISASDFSALLKMPEIKKIYDERVGEVNKKLSDYEKIKRFKLLPEEFSQEKEEITPTFKLRRHVIESRYKKEIEEMYGDYYN